MTIKKKLGLGVASAALGLSLVGGGTWAAFNDVENLSNDLATGTLDLGLTAGADGVETTFNLSNLKPGDEFTRSFKLTNDGTLAIKDVWLDVTQFGFANGANEFVDEHGQPDNDALEFLDQFAVEILRTGVEAGNSKAVTLVAKSENVTLRDLVEGKFTPNANVEYEGSANNVSRIDLAPSPTATSDLEPGDDNWNGIPADPDDYEIVDFKISMINDTTKVIDSSSDAYNEYTQNKYQGDSIDLNFEFEATQWNGIIIDENGYVDENEKANPTPANTDEVTRP